MDKHSYPQKSQSDTPRNKDVPGANVRTLFVHSPAATELPPPPPAVKSNLATVAAATAPPAASDSLTGAAVAVALLRYPGTAPDTTEAIARLTLENGAILDDTTGGAAILQALASQLAILEAIFIRYTLNAEHANTPEQATALMKLALAAQTAWVRAASVLVMAKAGARVLP